MRYADFLEEAYHAIREQAPSAADGERFPAWVVSVGEILQAMPFSEANYWTDQYASLLVVKYPHITPNLAYVCLRHGLTEAQAGWPRHLPVIGG